MLFNHSVGAHVQRGPLSSPQGSAAQQAAVTWWASLTASCPAQPQPPCAGQGAPPKSWVWGGGSVTFCLHVYMFSHTC